MTRYYYGDIEFGNFYVSEDNPENSIPLAIVNNLQDVRDFSDPTDAFNHFIDTANSFQAFMAEDERDCDGRPYQIVLRGHLQPLQI